MSRATASAGRATSAGAEKIIAALGAAHAALLLLAVAAANVDAQEPVPSSVPTPYVMSRLGAYAAQVSWRFVHNAANRTSICRGEGSAVFLGGNRFLTAAHVVDQNPLMDVCAAFGRADPVISFGSAELRAKVLASSQWRDEDGLTYDGGADLALLEVDARMIPVELRSPAPLALCVSDPSSATEVRVATEYGVFTAQTRPSEGAEFARIDLAARPGHSGSGVFDPEHGCLIGIISNGGVNGANYVANRVMRRFLWDEPAVPSTVRAQALGDRADP